MPAKRVDSTSLSAPTNESSERLRQPQQVRGERRVEAILDAAAALIVEGGAESLTVQALAERAQTSKGSLYHFFPDLRAVLCALADRHTAALTTLCSAMIADRGIPWSTLPVAATVDQFLAPLSYLETHPDLLALARTPVVIDQSTQRLMPYRELAAHILQQRCDTLTARQRLAGAAAMVAIVDGIVGYGLRSDDVRPEQLGVELRRALGAYLNALEEGASGAERGSAKVGARPQHGP
jgi:AcrR family transcriptional regulator